MSCFDLFPANSQTVQLFQFSPLSLIFLRRFKFDHQFDFTAVRNPITRKLNFPLHKVSEVMEAGNDSAVKGFRFINLYGDQWNYLKNDVCSSSKAEISVVAGKARGNFHFNFVSEFVIHFMVCLLLSTSCSIIYDCSKCKVFVIYVSRSKTFVVSEFHWFVPCWGTNRTQDAWNQNKTKCVPMSVDCCENLFFVHSVSSV